MKTFHRYYTCGDCLHASHCCEAVACARGLDITPHAATRDQLLKSGFGKVRKAKFDDAFYGRVQADMWAELGIPFASYNSQICREFISIISALITPGAYPKTVQDMADAFNLAPTHVELIVAILIGAQWVDYGTSPRAPFLNPEIDRYKIAATCVNFYTKEYATTGVKLAKDHPNG